MTRSYTMQGVQGAADRAVAMTRAHLMATEPGGRIHDVQDDPRFRHRGVDLLWERSPRPPHPGEVLGIEVKGDRNGRRGNFFFELVSNFERNSPGCFLYSTADLLAYVFLEERELHLLPLSEARAWFLPRAKEFELRSTKTRTGPHTYTTIGALVPVRRVLSEVVGATRHPLDAIA